MGRKKQYSSTSEKLKAYRKRRELKTEQKQNEQVAKVTCEKERVEKRLEEIEYVERKWSEMRDHPDLGPEFLRMDLNFIHEGYGYATIFKCKKEKIREAIKRGELYP